MKTVKKALSLVLSLSMVFAASATAFAAEPGTVYEWDINNFCTGGDFEDAPAGALPTLEATPADDTGLEATGGWFSNIWDIPGTVAEGEGFNGGDALKIAGNGSSPYGAAFYKLPVSAEEFGDKDVIAVSFLYKLSDAMKEGGVQLHAHIITGNSVTAAGEQIIGIKNDPGENITYGITEVGTPVGDGWYRVTGTIACETFGDRQSLRLFADFRQPEGVLGSDAYVLFDDVQVGEAALAVDADAQENRSTTNLIKAGDFEDYGLGEQLATTYDDNGWGSTTWDYESTSIMRDGDSKVLRLAGNDSMAYGVALYQLPELTADHTYRLSFDYKFIDNTDEISLQAHAEILNDGAVQTLGAGGLYNINLLTNPGEELDNGYTRVTMDFTPSAFETSLFTDLRFFIQLGGAGADTGIYIDNVSLYDLADVDETGDTTTTVEGGSTTTTVEGGSTTTTVEGGATTATNTTAEPTDADGTNDPDTGVASAVVPALLLTAASAMAIGASRRRRG